MKINLLRNKGGDGGTRAGQTEIKYENTSFDIKAGGGAKGFDKDSLVKLIVVVLGTGLLMLYENNNITTLQAQLAELTAKNQTVVTELNEKKLIADRSKDLQKNIKDLEDQIQVVKNLSHTRLREIKTIDFLQNIIPERVWLTQLAFLNGDLRIEGGAMSDEQLNKFIESMESSPYFKNVILMKAIEQKSGAEGTVKMFNISSNLASVD